MKTRQQYRVRWKRVGLDPKRKSYWTERAACRWMALLGPEPWTALGKKADTLVCCNGYNCACGGRTWREYMMDDRSQIPPIEYIEMDVREVQQGEWERVRTEEEVPGQ